MIRTLVVDDDARNRDYLIRLLRQHAGVQEVQQASNIADAASAIAACPPDLLLLDVEMPGGSGFDLLSQLGSWPFGVIFTTAFQRYAIQAIRFSAFDYLLKPVQPDELEAALQRFRAHRHAMDHQARQSQLLINIRQDDGLKLKLTLTRGDRTFFVPPADISHCTADDNYTDLHAFDGQRFTSARTLKDYEEMLLPFGFLRIHRSNLVNRQAVAHVEEGHVVLRGGQRVELSRRKRDEVLRALAS